MFVAVPLMNFSNKRENAVNFTLVNAEWFAHVHCKPQLSGHMKEIQFCLTHKTLFHLYAPTGLTDWMWLFKKKN